MRMGWRYMGERNSSMIVTFFSLIICRLSSFISCRSLLTSVVPRSFLRTESKRWGQEMPRTLRSARMSPAEESLTTLGFVLLVAVDEQEPGALGGKGQDDALQQGRNEDEAQQQWPERVVSHDQVQTKHLRRRRGIEPPIPAGKVLVGHNSATHGALQAGTSIGGTPLLLPGGLTNRCQHPDAAHPKPSDPTATLLLLSSSSTPPTPAPPERLCRSTAPHPCRP